METETQSGSSLQFVIGLVWSVLAIIIPGYLWTQGIYPNLMLGVTVGSIVRFGTDLVLMALIQDTGAKALQQFASEHVPVVVAMMVVQFGFLFGGLGWFIVSGSMTGLGIFAAMIASYIFGIVSAGIGGRQATPTAPEPVESGGEDEEAEFKFDVDDFAEPEGAGDSADEQ